MARRATAERRSSASGCWADRRRSARCGRGVRGVGLGEIEILNNAGHHRSAPQAAALVRGDGYRGCARRISHERHMAVAVAVAHRAKGTDTLAVVALTRVGLRKAFRRGRAPQKGTFGRCSSCRVAEYSGAAVTGPARPGRGRPSTASRSGCGRNRSRVRPGDDRDAGWSRRPPTHGPGRLEPEHHSGANSGLCGRPGARQAAGHTQARANCIGASASAVVDADGLGALAAVQRWCSRCGPAGPHAHPAS